MADGSLLPPEHRSGIYEIVNTINGKRYVGSAVSFNSRWNEHRCMLKKGKHHSRHLQASWNRNGQSAFEFRRLIVCEKRDLLMYEQIAIDALKPEFNVARIAGSSIGCVRTPETRAKISAKARGRKCPPRSAEYRAKISAAHKGRMPTPEHMAALQAGRRARVPTADEQQARSESLKQAWAEGRRSRVKSDATKAKMSAAFSKLSADQVRQMKKLHAEGATGVELSARFDTPRSTVSQIVRGLRYRWVTDE